MADKQLSTREVLLAANKQWIIRLGGSRRMNLLAQHTDVQIPIVEDTDYDYYATHTPELEQFLVQHGFDTTDFVKGMESASDSYALDDEAVTILERDNVQIVLRKDACFYEAVFENIPPWFYRQYLWKSSGEPTVKRENIRLIFNMLFAIGRAAQGAQ